MDQTDLLAGIRILDLADHRAAFCSKVLADLGASVIKLEKNGGDHSRRTNVDLYHNFNKRIITLDIETQEGRERLLKLSHEADVIIESFAPGYMAALGCSFEVLSKENPGLIMASVTGFGQHGPRSGYKSSDLIVSAYGGQMHVTGETSSPPLRLYGQQSSYAASLFAAAGILLAVIRRRTTGKGEHLDISMQEAVAGTLDHVLVRYLYDGVIPARQGDLSWNRSAFILPCQDGHIFISIAHQWETIVEWVSAEGMAQDLADDKWKDENYRHQHVDHIREVLQQWTMAHKAEELFEIAQAMRLPWAPVYRPEDVLSCPQLQARGFLGRMEQPETGSTLLCPGKPYKFISTPCSSATNHAPWTREEKSSIRGRDQTKSSSKDILKGIRILDFTWVLAGPFATRLLADFGAEVIKVQSLKTSKSDAANLDGYFSMWNRNKKSITLDMSRPEARELFLRLAAISDVVIENFSPRVMSNWGLTYEKLKEVNPKLIMVSMSAMGQTGPWKDYVAFGPALHALSGLTWLSSYRDGEPVGPGYAYGDHVIGLYGALAVLASLVNRHRNGCGQYADLSGYEALCTVMGPAIMDASLDTARFIPQDNHSTDADACLSGSYRCLGTDRWCVISIASEEEWHALCSVLNRSDLLGDDRFRTWAGRKAHQQQLDDWIEKWTMERTAEEAVALLQESGVPAGVVQNAADLAHDPHLAARRFFVEMNHPALGRTIGDRPPVGFSAEEAAGWKPAPLLGEDNRNVFVDLLGLTEEEFRHYREKGIIA